MNGVNLPPQLPRLAWRIGLILAGLMVLMLGLRIFPGWFYLVREDGEFRLADPDAYFHFRQAAYALEHFPRLSRWDDFSFYPAVLRNDAAGLYDLALAGLAKLVALSGMAPMRALWWVCLWFPPLCATAIMPFVYLLVRRQATIAIGLAMALWYLLLPGLTLGHMTLGICDHHVVEMIFGVLCILLLQRLVAREREQPSVWWRPAWGAALPLAMLQFTWLGGPLFLIIFGLAAFGQLAADVLAGAGARALVRASVRYWLAFFILTAATGALFPDLIFLPYLWKATLAGTTALVALLAAAGWFFETPRLKLRPALRLALGAGSLAALAVLLLAVSPVVQEYVWVGLGPKALTVAENQEVTARLYVGVTGLAGILGLLAPLAGIASGIWRRPAWWMGVLPSLCFLALWCRTHDYGYQGALHAILLTGYFFGAIAVYLYPATKRPRWLGIKPALAACTVAVALCGWPAQWTAPWWLPGDWYETGSGMPNDGWIEAMRWLRQAAPPPPPPVSPPLPGQPPRGRVGVLTDWTDGQFVNTLAGLPATSSRYPVAEGMAPFFLQTEDAVRAAALRGSTVATAVRYVALGPRTIAESFFTHRMTVGLQAKDFYGRTHFFNGAGRNIGVPTLGPAYDSAFATRLLIGDGNGLAHFRLIFESQQQSFLRFVCHPQVKVIEPRASLVLTPALREAAIQNMWHGLWKENEMDAYLGHLLAAVKIFEQVEGARLAGRAPAGSNVVLQIPLRLRTSGRAWLYRQSIQADARGRFQLTVPYSTEPAPGTDLEPTGPASLFLEAPPTGTAPATVPEQISLTIPETAVQNGDRMNWRGWLGQPSPTIEP